jgi:allantoinase
LLDLIVAGTLALPDGRLVPGEVGVRDGAIAAMAEPGELRAHERLDARRALVLPGQVDAHVHTRSEPTEGVTRATRAAAAGGVTTIVDMPYDDPEPVTTAEALRTKAAAVERDAVVDVALFATLAKTDGLDEIEPLLDAGAAAFKLSTFETHPVRFPRISDADIYLALERLAPASVVTAFHPENDELVRRLSQTLQRSGRDDGAAHAAARPAVAETEAIARVLELARATRAPVHLCHVSVARGFELVARARADGVDATAETCAHYLLLDEADLDRQGGRAKTNPPLRSRREVEALWRLLSRGAIDLVTSDHVGWPRAAKETRSIWAAKSGLPSVELTLPLLFSEGVVTRGLPLARLLAVLGEHPARRYGLWPRKGSLTVGADADIVLLDPDARWRVDEAQLVSEAGWSPYHGRQVTGRVTDVLVRGRFVVRGGEVTSHPGDGGALLATRPAAAPVPA